MDSFTQSGHQIKLKINGVEVGAARSANMNQDFGVEGAYVIGSIMPMEHMPQRWNGTIEIDKFYIRKDISVAANFEVSSEGILTVNPVDIEVIDKVSNQTVFIAQACTLTSSGVNFASNAFTGERASLVSMRIVRSEIGKPVLPSGIS